MSTRLAAFALSASMLTGCATTMEGIKHDTGKIFGQNDNPTPTQVEPAQNVKAAPVQAPLLNPRLAEAIDKVAASQNVNFSGADAENLYRREETKASAGHAGNSYSNNSVQNQTADAGRRAINVAKEKAGTLGKVFSGPADRVTRVPVQQGQNDQQMYALLKASNERVNSGYANPETEALNIVRHAAAHQRAKDRLIESGTNEMVRDGSKVIIEKTLPRPKSSGGAFGDLLNKIIPK